MTRHKERTLDNLYNVTPALSKPEITPVLSGTCRMQGSVDESDYDLLSDMVVSQSDKDINSCSDRSQKAIVREKSGTCNVCSAPCSSCLHNYQFMMVRKSNNFSGETCTDNAAIDPGRQFEIGQHSESSNVMGINSTSDSFSENVVGKTPLRTSDASKDALMLSKYEEAKFQEGHGDNLSSTSAANEAKVFACGVQNLDGTNLHGSFTSTSSPVEEGECPVVYQSSSQHIDKVDVEDGMVQTSGQSKINRELSGKVPPSSSPTGTSSQNLSLVEIPLKSVVDSSESMKVDNPLLQDSNGKPVAENTNLMDLEEDLHRLPQGKQLECSPDPLNSRLMEEVISDVCDDAPNDALDSIKRNEDMEVEVHHVDENDDSDLEEHDVKVCDICGDAGREDLLAICSQCIDGAEHTYCMREMVTKLPEGNWLCEECKIEEQMTNQRQDKNGWMELNEINTTSGQASSENINSGDVEGNRTKGFSNTKSCGKRQRDDNEVSSVAKKLSVESIMGSPRNSNSSKAASLSRESSFKNLDRGRMQPSNQSSSATLPVNETLESASTALDPRIQAPRGIFSKSHSFNSLNSKPKVKLVDQVALQRLKSIREPASSHMKEGAVKSMGKSISFKSTTSGRAESKVKMMSPRLSHIQDAKHRKERSLFERRSSFKSERPLVNSMAKPTVSTSNNDKKLGSLAESSSFSNRRETKAAQSDNKSMGLSKAPSLAARRNSVLPSSLGEFKRPSSYTRSTTGVSSTNTVNNNEQKLNQTVSKEDSLSFVGAAETQPSNANEGLDDGLFQSKEATNSSEQMTDQTGNRSWTNGVRVIFCQKCKEFGHLAQSCTADVAGAPATGPTAKFMRGENDNLKVAIEAAMLRKPGFHRKNRAGSQSDESSVSSMNSEISSSGGKRNVSSTADMLERHTVRSGLIPDSLKQETCDMLKQSTMLPVEGLSSRVVEPAPNVLLDGKSSIGGTSACLSAAAPIFLKSLAIPEHECIWQGSFEVLRSGTILDLREGIQAHLSTCASLKVVEAVNKFNNKISLNEVPRLSTWPVQFQEFGVREDNIALFFFARDRDSYEKSYKVLLERMMKNDLALNANLNGVELLIFPSNQLPENSQRWNMLFFLWGVFRGKRENCSDVPEHSKQFCTPQNIPAAIMSLPENRCSVGPTAKDLSACADVVAAPDVSTSEKLQCVFSSEAVNGDCGTKVSSVDERLSTVSPSTLPSTSAKMCYETSGTCPGGDTISIFTPEAESQATDQIGEDVDKKLMQLDAAFDRRQLPHYINKDPAATKLMASGGSISAGIISDKMNSTRDQPDFRIKSDKEAASEHTDFEIKADNRWPFIHNEHLHEESKYAGSQTVYTGTSQAMPRDDSADVVVIDKESGSDEGSEEGVIPEQSGNKERYFFPVDPHRVNGIGFINNSMPWKMHVKAEEELQDKVPDLELALGAERKRLPHGIPPFLVGKVEKAAANKAEDDASASLSLSLSFPSVM